jgi:molecular chaperone Hsp33
VAASFPPQSSLSPADELVRTVSRDGSVLVRALVATQLVREAARRHGAFPTAAAALGRSLMGAVLLAAGAKDEETVQLQFRGDGPLRSLTVIADAAGRVRGFAGDPSAHPPPRDGKLNVAAALGRGVLAVVRYHPSWREPYTGVVPLVSGEIAEDLAHYLNESEQKPSAVALGVYIDACGEVEAAGGFLVQALPGSDDETLARLERTIHSIGRPSQLVRAGVRADDWIDRLLEGIGSGERQRTHPAFFCRCDRDRVRQAVVLLGRNELHEIARSGEELEVRCEFCASRYRIPADEVGSLVPDA